MVSLFGFEFKRKEQPQDSAIKNTSQFTPETRYDGAISVAAGGSYGTYMDMDGTIRTDVELITKYREMAQQPELDIAIEAIVNDSIVQEEDNPILSLNLDKVKNLPAKIKNALIEEFDNALTLLQFNIHSYDIFRSFYVDGRLYYNVVIDNKDSAAGIQKLIYIDPRKIKKVREIIRKKIGSNDNNTPIAVDRKEYYIFNEKGFGMSKNISNYSDGNNPVQGIKLAPDTVIYITSGLVDSAGKIVLSYLHKAIKNLNALRALEDATVIYRISRAPERRVFYIDVGNMPKIKAEQYLRDMMTLHKNKLVYDGATGQILDDRKFMTMTEDYWLPRREGSKGTEILTLPAGQNLGKMEDVEYFQKKLYRALHVPFDRLQDSDDSGFGADGSTISITREEMRFARFVDRIRLKFSELFKEIIGKNCVLKGIMTIEEWEQIAIQISFDYAMDNYLSEIKEREILTGRLTAEQLIEPLIGRFYSNEWVRKHVLHQTDDQIAEIDAQIAEEQDNPQYMTPEVQQQMTDQVSQQQDHENQMALQQAKPKPKK